MSVILDCRIDGDPVGKGRPRFTRAGRAYTPAKTRLWEQGAARVFASAAKRLAGRSERLRVIVVAGRRIPKGRKVADGGWCPIGTDIDNILKAVLDALQKAKIVPDDRQVVEVVGRKVWATEPYVSVAVESVSG